MSLSRKIAAEVDDLVKTGAPPRCIRVSEGPHAIDLPVTLATPMGVECSGFEFRADDRGALSMDELRAWGDRLSARVTYLMEPLKPQEADALAGEVLMRSGAPTEKGGRRSYYEARLKSTGALRFDRIAYDESARTRKPIPCQFTSEVVERLADDLVATAP